MLFGGAQWQAVADGRITVAFRRWRRPTVKAGGTLRSGAGYLAIDAVEVLDSVDDIDPDDVARAGHDSLEELIAALRPAEEGRQLYRIAFHPAGADPRDALRADDRLGPAELAAVRVRMDRMDRAAPSPWTRATLRVIADHPEVVSTELAPLLDQERQAFKANVRKLKALGLTVSHRVGYELSPRGRAVLAALEDGR
ncbi:hypothetical protein [Euzebya sp.]|uniref:hypothetical protein n=1 Tax=Euzebya sp. TaxID=1971409 RepID=UPI003517B346